MRGKLLIIPMCNSSFFLLCLLDIYTPTSALKFQVSMEGDVITGELLYINIYITLQVRPYILRENILINTFVCRPKLSQIQLIFLPVNTSYILKYAKNYKQHILLNKLVWEPKMILI